MESNTTGLNVASIKIDGAALLDDICALIQCFVAITDAQARVIALWVAHTHAFAAAECTPYLSITSAEKQSGKTRLLEVLDMLVANPWFTGRVTAAVLFRKIDKDHPTLLLDESDAAFSGDPEYAQTLRGVLNTGYRRSGKWSCCVGHGKDIDFKDFETFSPKAIAGIGKLPDTVADRSIPIRLKRAARGENVQRFRRRDVESVAAELRDTIAMWCNGIVEHLRIVNTELPDELSDRQQDGAEPLFAIADAAGGDWTTEARRAVVALCSDARKSDESIGVRLLTDIRQIFNQCGADRISSADVVTALAEIETSPWAEWKNDKPITPPKVAALLSAFDIKPHSIRVRDKVLRGYDREDFKDVWKCYLPATWPQGATPLQANENAGSGDFQTATADPVVAAPKRRIPNKNAGRSGVAVQRQGRRRKRTQ